MLSHDFDRGASAGMVPGRMAVSATPWTDGRFLWQANVAGRPTLVATDVDGHTDIVLDGVTAVQVARDGREAVGLGLFHDRPPGGVPH